MEGSKSEGQKSLCNYISNSLTNIDEKIQNFWKLESYGTLPKMSPELLPPNEKRSLVILQETTVIKDNCIKTGLPWKKEEPALPHNRSLALNRYQFLEKKFQKKKTLPSSIANKLMKVDGRKSRKSKHAMKLPITCFIRV